MFRWYRDSQVCYVYLSDVPEARDNPYDEDSFFRSSKWFSRGWTLQELIAPQRVEFFDQKWDEIGTKVCFKDLIKSITGITHLLNSNDASVAQKFSWAARRETTRIEDQAYCLMGIFSVNMPLLYGEGSKAFLRLQLQILDSVDDDSIFAWEGWNYGGLLAASPALFAASGNFVRDVFDSQRSTPTMTAKGLRVELCLRPSPVELPKRILSSRNQSTKDNPTTDNSAPPSFYDGFIAPLNCSRSGQNNSRPFLKSVVALEMIQFKASSVWRRGMKLITIDLPATSQGSVTRDSKYTMLESIYVPQRHRDDWIPSPPTVTLLRFRSLLDSGYEISEQLTTVYTETAGFELIDLPVGDVKFSANVSNSAFLITRTPKVDDTIKMEPLVLVFSRRYQVSWINVREQSGQPLLKFLDIPDDESQASGRHRISKRIGGRGGHKMDFLTKRLYDEELEQLCDLVEINVEEAPWVRWHAGDVVTSDWRHWADAETELLPAEDGRSLSGATICFRDEPTCHTAQRDP